LNTEARGDHNLSNVESVRRRSRRRAHQLANHHHYFSTFVMYREATYDKSTTVSRAQTSSARDA
jgi:predicted kinase